ncbi:GNAT family N-acetyltransferase [Mariprofundus erugo]|nr:GNAT family N-acetyltransferase [Mariprofundus erugo]
MIEPLSRCHNRRGFQCGVGELDYFLGKVAMQHADKGISRTFVMVPEENRTIIIGFYTLTVCEVKFDQFASDDSKPLPKNHPIPAAKLARLAVARDFRGQHFGTKLLIHAMESFLQAQSVVGMSALFVNAKDDQAACFYRKYGFSPCSDDPLCLYLPTDTIRRAFQ